MAEAAINDKLPVRIDAGGGLFLDDGTTQHDIYALDGSSVTITPGGYEPLRRKDKGQMVATLEGDERPTTISFRVKCTAAGSSNLQVLAEGRETSGSNGGLMKVFTVYIKHPDYKGASTGYKSSIANCSFVGRASFKGGGPDFDMWEFEMESTEPVLTRASY